ncbi:MAG: hypothetical protein K0S65_3021 [Labilithrix sp.]|nr:hypothetical protein [Labilithrix sp.]
MRYTPDVGARSIFAVVTAALLAACSREGGASPRAAEAPPADAAAPGNASSPSTAAAVTTAEAPPACEESPDVFFFVSPAAPVAGKPLRVLAVSERPLSGKLEIGAGGAAETTRRGGPPYFWLAEVRSPSAGPIEARFTQSACGEGTRGAATKKLDVRNSARASAPPPKDGLWPVRASWTRSLENVYSAWIEALFDAPEGEQPSWPALHEVLRDPSRNLLFDHLGSGEDGSKAAPVIRPDCADLPYFLRAYFAWKLGLPFGLAECNRGGGGAPPSCHGLITNEDADERADSRKKDGAVAAFGAFLRGTLADKAHSGSARTPFEDQGSDYYPVSLSWANLRPGTVYADPYGHILVIAKRLPQTTERGGLLYAVDGQPDGTVARKRFWRGNFLYANQRELGGPGFKHFRPLVRHGGKLARLDDAAISASTDYGDASRAPGKLDVEGFYDAMDDVLSPRPLDPERAMLETIGALEEQVRTRVLSVDNGRKWLADPVKSKSPAPMPEGGEIFETTGPWEDFSTPSRDLRLLIAIDVVKGFPARVARRPERYATTAKSQTAGDAGRSIESELATVLTRELENRKVTYTRTDGSPFTLTLAEVVQRSGAFEMTYNPNDCVETRWGAPPGSPEFSTCRAHAPTEQRTRMETYRPWFHERRRPPRK